MGFRASIAEILYKYSTDYFSEKSSGISPPPSTFYPPPSTFYLLPLLKQYLFKLHRAVGHFEPGGVGA
ncbi:MAG TPA: hypothetical protein PK228_08590, partial [Saprospiraceae bacterium]|nr:hypothetical protein [Saprospiraceae bacterium]